MVHASCNLHLRTLEKGAKRHNKAERKCSDYVPQNGLIACALLFLEKSVVSIEAARRCFYNDLADALTLNRRFYPIFLATIYVNCLFGWLKFL